MKKKSVESENATDIQKEKCRKRNATDIQKEKCKVRVANHKKKVKNAKSDVGNETRIDAFKTAIREGPYYICVVCN